MSNCDYCVAPRKCNCGVKCLNCFKAKHLYETSLKILHYQPNQPTDTHNCGEILATPTTSETTFISSVEIVRKKTNPQRKRQRKIIEELEQQEKDQKEELKKLNSELLQINSKISPIKTAAQIKIKAENLQMVKPFYCYLHMCDRETRCCTQCEQV